ncbi:hypothetical protein [Streptacidiphilus melanogenes]|uniref:hypothetical protein n=1 Tax=Streptacidiphilus melanogenes TaxID=411235 RepID=UPI000A5AD6C8|nr:hypothetical protein [Streptacidiphilus melanogenes]
MPTPAVVITTRTSDTYHAGEDCKIFLADRDIARTDEGSAPDVILVPLGEALAHRHPCLGCLR